jgi:hypothetical protein
MRKGEFQMTSGLIAIGGTMLGIIVGFILGFISGRTF